MPEVPQPSQEPLPEHLRHLASQADEAGERLDPLARSIDRLVEACDRSGGAAGHRPRDRSCHLALQHHRLMGDDVFDRAPLRGKSVPRAEREAWLANRVGPMPGTCIPDD